MADAMHYEALPLRFCQVSLTDESIPRYRPGRNYLVGISRAGARRLFRRGSEISEGQSADSARDRVARVAQSAGRAAQECEWFDRLRRHADQLASLAHACSIRHFAGHADGAKQDRLYRGLASAPSDEQVRQYVASNRRVALGDALVARQVRATDRRDSAQVEPDAGCALIS